MTLAPCGGPVCPYCQRLIEGAPALSVAICCEEVGHAYACGTEGRCIDCEERAAEAAEQDTAIWAGVHGLDTNPPREGV